MPGWRIGWAIATGPRESLHHYLEAVTGCCGRVCRLRIHFSMPSSPRWKGHRTTFPRCFRSCSAGRRSPSWAERTPRVSLVKPKGAFYAYPSLDIPEDDLTFVTDLLKQKHVLVVHGSGFGQKPGTRHMRIVFLPQDEVLHAAYGKITDFMGERYKD